jgi:hypothetical protein
MKKGELLIVRRKGGLIGRTVLASGCLYRVQNCEVMTFATKHRNNNSEPISRRISVTRTPAKPLPDREREGKSFEKMRRAPCSCHSPPSGSRAPSDG